ncbi:MAG: Crp/Fnr family transcriptional regulator [Syntrophobacterales bacterium]|jgi:CRP-like cAMP-binding protein|nr:Crp/Fnr family transcriptional regulator [Syntrophobacterales bacterium]
MENNPSVLKKCHLFADIAENDLDALLGCLSAARRGYEKNAFIFQAEDKVFSVGVVLSGSVHVIQDDYWGNRSIFANIGQAGLFGEAFSCAEIEKLPVSVIAAEPAEILFIGYRKIITTCSNTCAFHTKLIKNMMRILARQNILLIQKMEFLSRRTTREKLLSYLSEQALQSKSSSFSIPFNRQELADYLCVDRSALSREMGIMQNEGLLRFNKNYFELLSVE